MHSMKNTDSKEFNMAKRVDIATEFNEYKDILNNKKVIRHKMKRIQSKKQKFGPHEVNKKPLSCFDDKRYILDDGIDVLAYFHKDLKKQEDF